MSPSDDDDDDRTIIRPPSQRAAAAPLGHTLPLGTHLLDYEITGLIGEGGFGIVYLAWDHSLQRKVAIKEYMPASMASRIAGSSAIVVKSERHLDTFKAGLKSFVNEARLLARFDHPALVKVYRFWEENGTAYMAMPFYEGPTLKTALAELGHAPSEAQLRAWLTPLLDALTVMHAAQCFHRDIAPDNILLTQTGPLLLDFGAARRVIGDMTHALTVVLKPGYAPIEQYGDVASMTQGAWTDIYALACVVYYAITGKTPMSSVERLMDDRLEPIAVEAKGRYGDGFLRAIDAALAVRPQDRPQNEAAVPRPARHRPAGAAALAAAERLRRPEPRAVPGDAGRRLFDRAGHADSGAGDAGAGAPGRAGGAGRLRRRSAAAGRDAPRRQPARAAGAVPTPPPPSPAPQPPAPCRRAARRPAAGARKRSSSASHRCWSSPAWRSASTGRCSRVRTRRQAGGAGGVGHRRAGLGGRAGFGRRGRAGAARAAGDRCSPNVARRHRSRRPPSAARAGASGTAPRRPRPAAGRAREAGRQPAAPSPRPRASAPTRPRREPARVEPPAESPPAPTPSAIADLSAGLSAGTQRRSAHGAVIFCKRPRSSH